MYSPVRQVSQSPHSYKHDDNIYTSKSRHEHVMQRIQTFHHQYTNLITNRWAKVDANKLLTTDKLPDWCNRISFFHVIIERVEVMPVIGLHHAVFTNFEHYMQSLDFPMFSRSSDQNIFLQRLQQKYALSCIKQIGYYLNQGFPNFFP